jgi:phosphoenolpyruvate synthase/pyruvate phosphate dikinase
MKGKQILDIVDLDIEDWSSYGLLGQRLSTIRKRVTLPPMFVISSAVFKDLVVDDDMPDGKHIPWEVELDIAKRVDEFESPVVRFLSSASYEYALPPLTTAGSKSDLIVGVDSLMRSFYAEEEVRTRERMGVPQFDVSVIVQKLLDPKSSGRLTQSETDTRIIAVHGLPMNLEDADSFIVNMEGELTYHATSEQEKKWVLGENDVEQVEIEEGHRDAHKLTEKQVVRLASVGKKILEECGEEIVIEWNLVRNSFYVLALYPTKIVVTER